VSDRIPETHVEPRATVRGGTKINPYVWLLLVIAVVAGVHAAVLLWATSAPDTDEYNPEGDLFNALGYAWAAVAVMAGLVLLGVKAVLWKAPSQT
jgi:hypothetical protein